MMVFVVIVAKRRDRLMQCKKGKLCTLMFRKSKSNQVKSIKRMMWNELYMFVGVLDSYSVELSVVVSCKTFLRVCLCQCLLFYFLVSL